jgi:hypothetical protein
MHPILPFAAGGVVGAAWEQLRAVFGRITGIMLTKVELAKELGDQFTRFMLTNAKCVQPNYGLIYGWLPVWFRGRMKIKLFKTISQRHQLVFWYNGRPIWCAMEWEKIVVRYVRGTVKFEDLLKEMAKDFEHRHEGRTLNTARRRFRITHIIGDSRQMNIFAPLTGGNKSGGDDPADEYINKRQPTGNDDHWVPLTEDAEDSAFDHGKRLDALVLNTQALRAVKEIEQWLVNEQWYEDRSVPWRRSYMVTGDPGTGKSSFVRAVGYDFDLPIYSYDLSSLSNKEFGDAWFEMLSNRPCIALFEDIDAVFHGRENKAGNDLSFDFLINCIDGVDEVSGVLVFMTANHRDKLDPAICSPEAGGDSAATRPGRVDRVLTFGNLDSQGKEQMARLILKDCPEAYDEIRQNQDELTPAQFKELCLSRAFETFWENGDDSHKTKEE